MQLSNMLGAVAVALVPLRQAMVGVLSIKLSHIYLQVVQ